MILTFGEFQLDSDRFELRRNGQLRKVEPKVFDLVAHFAKNPGRVFSRDDLVASVWHGRVVSDATVSTCIKNARKAVGDSGVAQRYIKTVRGRGSVLTPTLNMPTSAPVPGRRRRTSTPRDTAAPGLHCYWFHFALCPMGQMRRGLPMA